MSEVYASASARGAIRHPVPGAAGWLCLAATPTFAIMALFTAFPGGGQMQAQMQAMCLTEMSPLGGMTAMYLLMSVFHSPPWLKLLAGRRG